MLRFATEREALCLDEDLLLSELRLARSSCCVAPSVGDLLGDDDDDAKSSKSGKEPPHYDGEGEINRQVTIVGPEALLDDTTGDIKRDNTMISYSCGLGYFKAYSKDSVRGVELCGGIEEAKQYMAFGAWAYPVKVERCNGFQIKWFVEIPESLHIPPPPPCREKDYGSLSCNAFCTQNCGVPSQNGIAGVPTFISIFDQKGEFLEECKPDCTPIRKMEEVEEETPDKTPERNLGRKCETYTNDDGHILNNYDSTGLTVPIRKPGCYSCLYEYDLCIDDLGGKGDEAVITQTSYATDGFGTKIEAH